MEAIVYNQKGEKAGKVTLPEEVFAVPWNGDLVHQVATSMSSNQRHSIAYAKDRSKVAGGGRKPHRQKGTGRARHGSIRSPIWRGGGVAHGPTALKSYKKKINEKMKTRALYTILSEKLKLGEIFFIDKVELSDPKTKKAQEVLHQLALVAGFKELLSSKKKIVQLAIVAQAGDTLRRCFRNLPHVSLVEVRNINPLSLLQYKYLFITNPKESIILLSERAK